jgi:uncharacterized protein
MFRRPVHRTLMERLREARQFIQVVGGARQVGKTTLAQQVMRSLRTASHYASADDPTLRDRTWIEQQWDLGRIKAKRSKRGALLVLDEVQKIPDWSAGVKQLWDEDFAAGVSLKVMLLGSAPLLVQRGLAESLAGRFEITHLAHWSFAEMHAAFGWDLAKFIYYGGYPGAAALVDEPGRWARYIVDSLIETTVSRDILLMTRVHKPALLRRLFHLGCVYSGQILSYQKMLGQLQQAGNTTTLAHYLDLLAGAGMVVGLPKYSGSRVRQRGSSPKLQVLNAALMTAQGDVSFDEAQQDREHWGRLVENAVGAHLVNSTAGTGAQVFYWRERSREVDFVVQSGRRLAAIEVRSGASRRALIGMSEFRRRFRSARPLLVGGSGIPLDQFLLMPVADWLD